MSKRIRIILFLVFVSILAVVILQGYWINNSYKINKEQLLKEIDLALEKSVKQEMNVRMSQKAKVVFKGQNTSVFYVGKEIESNVKIDSIVKQMYKGESSGRAEITMNLNEISVQNGNLDSIPENFEIRVKEMITGLLANELAGEFKVNTNIIDSLFTDDLSKRGIELSHHIEMVNENDSLVKSFASVASDTLNTMCTRSFQVDILGKEKLRIRILNEQEVIFGQMMTGLISSLVLILLILFCFLYMLSTIFKQKQLSQIKNDFINNMTHELKTPIATVSAIVESMQNFGVLDNREKTNKYLDVSQNELGRLSGLVEKVLNMAREEREALKMSPEELNVRKIFDNIINSQTIKQEVKQVSFDLKVDEDAEKVTADRFHMVNVMQNLIENSIKYSDDPVMIRIACERNGEYLKISVSDNGIGISKKHQAKVFDQFYRVSTGDVHDVKGFGLGLHYVRNIVEKHSGKIGLSSEVGKGSTFTINLPL
ncbi:sensor histidine kinase [Marinifilum flexuosum]|uniref:sensor histidine kinase n=1 Tax=Marinifilum flexuosum TaxID=1117708 RepID=UPI00249105A0|nr:HAMP domain-containing sensor histidine kinase [Marinifilum flexuosum]